jgi:hypothetical protein
LQAAVQQWLGDVIDIRDLEVEASDSSLEIDLTYVVRRTNEQQTVILTRNF